MYLIHNLLLSLLQQFLLLLYLLTHFSIIWQLMYLTPYQEICLFVLLLHFFIVSVTHFISKPYSSRDYTIFMISSISSFETVNAIPDPKNLFCIATSVATNPRFTKILLANGLSTYLIKGKSVFSISSRNLI